MSHSRLPLAIAAALLTVLGGTAHAQTCGFTIDSLDFGSIDVTTNVPFTTTGNYDATCSSILAVALRTCPNVGAGTGGGNPSGNPRYLTNGANLLEYNLYSDTYTTVWGSRLWAGTAPATDISLIFLGSGNASRPMYARVSAGQQAVPPGIYTSSFAGHTAITYQGYVPRSRRAARHLPARAEPPRSQLPRPSLLPARCRRRRWTSAPWGFFSATSTAPMTYL